MPRQAIALRLGATDTVPITAPGYNITEVQFVSGEKSLSHGIGTVISDIAKLGLTPSEIAIDLHLLAALVYAADTQVSRHAHSEDDWTRELKLCVPVSDVAVWNGVVPTLKILLNYLTGDFWDFEFRARPDGFETLVKDATTVEGVDFTGVSLFSGGLDSLIGAIDELAGGNRPILVSHAGEGSASNAQYACFDAVNSHFKESGLRRIRGWLQFEKNDFPGLFGENSTRARSFLFFALGVLVGSGLSPTWSLRVPENGLIALNVPLDETRLGSLSTRTTHPFYMARWQELLDGLGVAGRIENPYWNRTKGEMVAQCQDQGLLASAVKDSLSCSSPTKGRWKGLGVQHCGYCLPCLIRRAALLAGMKSGDPTTYTLANLDEGALSTRTSEGQQVRSFQVAIEKLSAKPHLARLLVHKNGSLADFPERLDDYADVYRRGMGEVEQLLAGVVTSPS